MSSCVTEYWLKARVKDPWFTGLVTACQWTRLVDQLLAHPWAWKRLSSCLVSWTQFLERLINDWSIVISFPLWTRHRTGLTGGYKRFPLPSPSAGSADLSLMNFSIVHTFPLITLGYVDSSFHSWNFLSSIGSGITFLSFAIFFPFFQGFFLYSLNN